MIRFWKNLPFVDGNVRHELDASLEAGGGVLQLLQAWVHREFCNPGHNLRLHHEDYYIHGPRRGTDERWFASCMAAQNTHKIDHEGLSFVLSPNGRRFLLSDAVQEQGELLVGKAMWDAFKKWYVYSKFFDNEGALPWHAHMRDADAAKVGQLGKPESYYFSPHYNQQRAREPITFMGLRPGTTKEQVRRSLELWGQGGDDIRHLSQGYLMQPGTGWLMPPAIGHAPAGWCTFEPQCPSDTFQMYQARTSDGWLDRDSLLFKDIPDNRRGDFDHMVDLLDWEGNLDPDFARKFYLPPVVDTKRSGHGITRKWVVYGTIGGKEHFSASETTVEPGCQFVIQEPGASGVVFVTGRGTIAKHRVHVSTLMRFYEVVNDEFFISAKAAAEGVRVVNDGESDLVFLQYSGPNTWGSEMPRAGS